jgi:hypothetical protein
MAENAHRTLAPPSEEFLAEVKAFENRALSPAEFAARANAPMSEHEREDLERLVSWFTRTYPTAGERLRAVDTMTAQWLRGRPSRPRR